MRKGIKQPNELSQQRDEISVYGSKGFWIWVHSGLPIHPCLRKDFCRNLAGISTCKRARNYGLILPLFWILQWLCILAIFWFWFENWFYHWETSGNIDCIVRWLKKWRKENHKSKKSPRKNFSSFNFQELNFIVFLYIVSMNSLGWQDYTCNCTHKSICK